MTNHKTDFMSAVCIHAYKCTIMTPSLNKHGVWCGVYVYTNVTSCADIISNTATSLAGVHVVELTQTNSACWHGQI